MSFKRKTLMENSHFFEICLFLFKLFASPWFFPLLCIIFVFATPRKVEKMIPYILSYTDFCFPLRSPNFSLHRTSNLLLPLPANYILNLTPSSYLQFPCSCPSFMAYMMAIPLTELLVSLLYSAESFLRTATRFVFL